MFNLNHLAAYTWRDVFIVLSWGKYDDYLVDIEFPLTSDILSIRQVARDFVLSFHRFQWQVYEAQKLSDNAQQLFDETYQGLVGELGGAKTEILCEWGNTLHIDQRLLSSLHFIMRTMVLVTNEKNLSSKTETSSLSTTSQELIQALLQRDKEESREILNALDTIDENALQDEWGKTLFQIYVNADFADGTKDETPISPTDHLFEWIDFFRARSLLRRLKDSLSQEELETLNHHLRTHPSWEQKVTQSKSSPIYFQPSDLLELMEHIH